MRFLRLLLRDLYRQPRFALLFVGILSFGLTGFLLVESLRASVAHSLEANARQILSADLSVTLRRPFSAEERDRLEAAIRPRQFSRSVEFFSMVASGEASQLLLVRAVESNFPFYGELRMDRGGQGAVGARLDTAVPSVMVSPEVEEALGIRIGGSLRIGDSKLAVIDVVRNDPTQSFRNFAIGGRAFLHLQHVEGLGLLRPGSTATWAYYIKTESEAEANRLQQQLKALFPGAEWRFTTAKEAGESSLRALAYLGDFLGLISLVSLLLSALGAAYLYRSHLEKRSIEIAIERALGFPLSALQAQAALQTGLLAALALLPAVLLTYSFLPILERVIARVAGAQMALTVYPASLLPVVALCLVGTPLLLLPELLVLRRFTPIALFREQDRESVHRPFLHYLPAILFFASLAPLVSRSFRTAGIFLGMLLVLLLVLGLIFLGFSRLVSRSHGSWTSRHAFLLLARRRRAAAVVFLTLSLGSLLLHLLPQLESSLRSELDTPSRLPSLFLFDIQQEQKDALVSRLRERGHELSSISPLVRARILSVNGQAYERAEENGAFRTREDEQDSQFRNRAVNLTFRERLQESETVIRGEAFPSVPWTGSDQGLPAVSVETRYAKRIGVKIGDELRFDVQGTEVAGRIVNERRVRWTSFQPNFFLVFQDGVLNDAPLTYLANLERISSSEKRDIQLLLAKEFPNVSVIDVAATVARALELLGRMRIALALLSGLAIVAGLSVMASVLGLEARERANSLVLYRVLGAEESDLRRILIKESLVVCVTSVAFGAVSAVAFTYGLSRFLFDGAFALALMPLGIFSVLLVSAGLLLSWFATRSLVRRTPLAALRNTEY